MSSAVPAALLAFTAGVGGATQIAVQGRLSGRIGTLEAVATLMGSAPAVWMQAVRAASNAHILEMTGDWDEPSRPFVRSFLFPRKAAWAAKDTAQR